MNCSYTKIDKEELKSKFLAFIPKNKRGYPSKFNPMDILSCIIYKLKTGCQWNCLFVDIEGVKPPFSWNTVYYYFKKWGNIAVFKNCFESCLKSRASAPQYQGKSKK